MVKGDLEESIKEGLFTASWNKWVAEQGGEEVANLNGVPVGNLRCSVDENSYFACNQGITEPLRQREQLLENIRFWNFKADGKQELIQVWKESFTSILVELYSFRQAVNSIQEKYFEVYSILFPDTEKEINGIIQDLEKTLVNFNKSVADRLDNGSQLDLQAIRQCADKPTIRQMAYIVDMAKAEALDSLGEGEEGVKLVERYV